VNYECARKIPCIVPSFASRGLSCLWYVAPLEMNEGNSLGARVQSAYKAAVAEKPHTRPLTFVPEQGLRVGPYKGGRCVAPLARLWREVNFTVRLFNPWEERR